MPASSYSVAALSCRHDQRRVREITICQIGLFAAYLSCHGHTFIDPALHLQRAWTNDTTRLAAPHAAKGPLCHQAGLAIRRIDLAITAQLAFRWVTGDTIYRSDEVETVPRRAGKGYVLGVEPPVSSCCG